MGIVQAVKKAAGDALADQWLESIQADRMGETIVVTQGIAQRRGENTRGTPGVISNGSVIQVEQRQCMLLVDGGRIVDYTAEPGYYVVDGSTSPSILNGELSEAVKETFNRMRFGGGTPQRQQVFYINLQEIKNIRFGTVNPINYFDNFYNAELYLRCHGYFSIRVVDPLKFFAEAIPRDAVRVDIQDIHRLYLSEFLTALQSSINQMSVGNIRISHVTAKSAELARYLSTALDKSWTERRGMVIESVGIASISYDDQSKKLIDLRNQGAMLSDTTIREGYVQGSIARSAAAAASNPAGSMTGFMGLGMSMNQGSSVIRAATAGSREQNEREARQKAPVPGKWACGCGAESAGAFCPECGAKRPETPPPWKCDCGAENTGKFCINCGAGRPGPCPQCGAALPQSAKFCSECGHKVSLSGEAAQ